MTMDRNLFNMFIAELDDETFSLTPLYFVEKAKDKVAVGDKIFFNSYAGEGYSLQFIVDAVKNGEKIDVDNIFIHHTSPDVWDLKIASGTRTKDAYTVTTKDGHHAAVIRFVNHNSGSDKYKDGDEIKAQVVGFVLNGDIYENEKAYEEDTKNQKFKIADNCMMPLRFLINNSVNKSKEEKDAINPDDDRAMAAKFIVKSCHKVPLHIFEQDFPAYYSMEVETDYGDMHLLFPMNALNKPVKQFKKGDIFAGNIMLSGDVYFGDDK